MGKRGTLHRSRLARFEEWLIADGWEFGKLGEFQVINARKGKRRFCAYDRNQGDHFTVQESMLGVVAAFLRSEPRREA